MKISGLTNVKSAKDFSGEPSKSIEAHQCTPFYQFKGLCETFFNSSNLAQHIKTHANAHGRNTKLLKAKLLQNAEKNKGMQKIDRKPTAYLCRASRRKKGL
jgi:hypothetical protein